DSLNIKHILMIIILSEKNTSKKKRNIALTALLSVFLMADFYFLMTVIDSNPQNDLTDLGQKINYVFVICTILDLICCIYLFKWKKWAFWGTLIISLIIFFLNLYLGLEFMDSLIGLIGIILLY